jgi:FKBP-type peptidyl-prolyl cis-trans isomerase FkpA
LDAANFGYNLHHPISHRFFIGGSMSKAALREQRRAQRIAKRNHQRMILGIIAILGLALIAFLVYRDYTTKSLKYPIGTLDTSPPTPSASAVTTTSGLTYEDLQVGNGATAKTGDTVTVNYTGWLQDGTKFDSSIDSGQTFDFTIGAGNVIVGWDEGVAGMCVNCTRLLVIPPSLGYGNTASGSIPANSTLIFEVQLVAIK